VELLPHILEQRPVVVIAVTRRTICFASDDIWAVGLLSKILRKLSSVGS